MTNMKLETLLLRTLRSVKVGDMSVMQAFETLAEAISEEIDVVESKADTFHTALTEILSCPCFTETKMLAEEALAKYDETTDDDNEP